MIDKAIVGMLSEMGFLPKHTHGRTFYTRYDSNLGVWICRGHLDIYRYKTEHGVFTNGSHICKLLYADPDMIDKLEALL